MKHTWKENRTGIQIATQRGAAVHAAIVFRARACAPGGGLYAVELTATTAAEVAVTRTPTKSRYTINARVVAGARDVLCASVINFIRNNCNPHLSVRRCRSG